MLKECSNEYLTFLSELKNRIDISQKETVMAVNSELLMLYWNIGNLILKNEFWKENNDIVIDELSKDLKICFPDIQAFSERNLKYMCKFAEEYKDKELVNKMASKVSWSHNIILMDKIDDSIKRTAYINKIIENGWTKEQLIDEIELEFGIKEKNIEMEEEDLQENTNLTEDNDDKNNIDIENKSIIGINEKEHIDNEDVEKEKTIECNDNLTQGKQSIKLLKDSYMLDFLNILEETGERDLEKKFKNSVIKYFLQLNADFAFLGSDYHIEVEGEDYYIGLLFYNLKLRCYVNVELRVGSFKPEYLGKLSFYLSLIDDTLKKEQDKPSVGVVLCNDEGKLIVQYAFKDTTKPEEDKEYSLTQDIPKELRNILPTVKEIGMGIKRNL